MSFFEKNQFELLFLFLSKKNLLIQAFHHFSESAGDRLSNKVKMRKICCELRDIKVVEGDHVEGGLRFCFLHFRTV